MPTNKFSATLQKFDSAFDKNNTLLKVGDKVLEPNGLVHVMWDAGASHKPLRNLGRELVKI